MPIRFRCAYCNQLMGISTRKAGKVVRCPKCAGEIIVPVPEGMEPPPEPAEQPAAGAPAFEDKDFDQLLRDPADGKDAPSATAATENAPAPPQPELPSSAPSPAPRKRLGLFVPLGMLFVSVGVVILLLILVFVLGLIIGRHTVIAP